MATRFRNPLFLLLAIIFLVSYCGYIPASGSTNPANAETSIEKTLAEVCQEVGAVKKISKGPKGAPIIVLEENHTSRIGQLQQAIVLVRLYDRNELRDIALGGYLKERPAISTVWFSRAAHGTVLDRARVAATFLKDGEISSAEFMKLVYEDFHLRPIETVDEYSVTLAEKDSQAPLLYLLKIAQQSLTPEQSATVQELQTESEKLAGAKKQSKIKDMLDYLLSTNSWVQARANILQNPGLVGQLSSEQHLALVEEIQKKAVDLKLELAAAEQDAMERYLGFWQKRSAASQSMAFCATEVATESDASMVVMNIGSGHTDAVSKFLKTNQYQFAVTTSLAKPERSDLTLDMLERKYQRQPVSNTSFDAILLKALTPAVHKKPEPVLQEKWFQCKSELYLYTDRIVKKVLAASGSGSGKKPPYGFSGSNLHGKWVSIDPRKIKVVDADPQRKETKAVLFPATVNQKTIWVKAGLVSPNDGGEDHGTVEAILKRALAGLQTESKSITRTGDSNGKGNDNNNNKNNNRTMKQNLNNSVGQVKITSETLMNCGFSQDSVRKSKLGTN